MGLCFDDLDALVKKGVAYADIARLTGYSPGYVRNFYMRHGGKTRRRSREIVCPICGHPFRGRRGQVFCSSECSREHLYRHLLKEWEEGRLKRAPGGKCPRTVLEHEYRRQNGLCGCCGRAAERNRMVPYMMDGDSRNIRDGNVILLCPDCYVGMPFSNPLKVRNIIRRMTECGSKDAGT